MLNTFKKSQDLYKNRPWLTFLELVTLGTVVLAVCALLLGCGSDSTPGGSVKGKDAKNASIPAAKNSPAPSILMMGEKGAAGADAMADIKKQPEDKSVQMPGTSREEMEARNAAAIKKARSPGIEVMPGVTLEQMEKKNAAAVKMMQSQEFQAMRGTLDEMKKKNAAAIANATKKPPTQVNQGNSPPVGGK